MRINKPILLLLCGALLAGISLIAIRQIADARKSGANVIKLVSPPTTQAPFTFAKANLPANAEAPKRIGRPKKQSRKTAAELGITEAEFEAIEIASSKILEAAREIEARQASVVGQGATGSSRIALVAIAPPSTGQIGEISGAVSEELAKLKRSSNQEAAARQRLQEDYDSTVRFPNRVQLLSVTTTHATGDVWFRLIETDSPENVKISPEGSISWSSRAQVLYPDQAAAKQRYEKIVSKLTR